MNADEIPTPEALQAARESLRESWEQMSGEQQDELIASGWHPGPTDDVLPGQLTARAEAAEARLSEAHRECVRLQQALAGLESAVRILDVMLREPAAEGLMSAEDYRSYVQGAWLGVDEAAEKARDALAEGSYGTDSSTESAGGDTWQLAKDGVTPDGMTGADLADDGGDTKESA